METFYLGGMLRRETAEVAESGWSWLSGDNALSLDVQGDCAQVFAWDSLVLLIRGRVRSADSNGPLDLEAIAQELRCQYLETNELAVDGLEGSFTLALLDGQAGRIVLFRNLVGAGFTYYHAGADGFRFGSNLAGLVGASPATPRANLLVLPTYFLYRFVPGAETLFDGFFRLLPGEQVTWDGRTVTRRQRHTFADLVQSRVWGDPAELLEETTTSVLEDGAPRRANTANLLSGGVDSTYLQAIWNRLAGDRPRSFSVSVNHPRSRPDTDYALSAARELGSDHTLVPADGRYADYLLDLVATTGEPPNHVQSAYFGLLARTMAANGVRTGICGEGADSLFGLGLANQIHNAHRARSILPLGFLRKTVAGLSGWLGLERVAATFRLADRLNDFADLDHPINRVAMFADMKAVESCFGRESIVEAAAERRGLLDRLRVAPDPFDRLHAAGYLGEAVDSASLWTTLFNSAGADLCCPFLDSRMLRLALNLPREVRYAFRRPKELLKQALTQHVGEGMARRPKLGFGQPIFEWLAPGGQLRPLTLKLGRHEFVEPAALERSLQQPNWFLYSLLCYDVWHRLFIERSLSPAQTGRQRAGAKG